MIRRIRKLLMQKSGATLLIVLVFTLLATAIGTTMLIYASSVSGQSAQQISQQQAYETVKSAGSVLQREIAKAQGIITETMDNAGAVQSRLCSVNNECAFHLVLVQSLEQIPDKRQLVIEPFEQFEKTYLSFSFDASYAITIKVTASSSGSTYGLTYRFLPRVTHEETTKLSNGTTRRDLSLTWDFYQAFPDSGEGAS
jgi:Tfp pilus assembly protein PilX